MQRTEAGLVGRGAATVWVARPSARGPAAAAADRELLSPAETARTERFVRPGDRDRFVTAWALARRTLATRLGADPRDLRFDRTCAHCGHPAHGKPRLADATLEFSLAHAADRVLLAVTDDVAVGVDVEPSDALVAEVADEVLHPDERHLEGTDLVRVWVRKEAVLKASGLGLTRPMTGFAVLTAPPGTALVDLEVGPGYAAALAAVDAAGLDVSVVEAYPTAVTDTPR